MIAVACAVPMMLSLSANAYAISPLAVDYTEFMGSAATGTTQGGSNGKVNIRARVFKRTQEPSGGAHIYYCGVVSDISDAPNATTQFNVTGSLHRNSESVPISASGNAHSVTAQKIGDGYSYDYCNSTTIADSTAFGKATVVCNRAIT